MIRIYKKRYVGFCIPSCPALTKRQLLNILFQRLHSSPQNWIRILEYRAETGIGIILCSHTLLPRLRRVFHEITETPEKNLSIQLLGVSGTIKALRRKFLAVKR